MRRARHFAALLAAAALIVAREATAHSGTGLAGGFASGFAHPFSGFDHLLAMVAVGIWGACLGQPLIYALPVVFPALMVAGATLGLFAVPVPFADTAIGLSVVVLGGCIALSLRAPVWAACLIVGTFAVFHGYAHGHELPAVVDPVGYSAGFVLATGLLHVLGIGVGRLADRPDGRTAVRGLGAAIGAMGVWFLLRAVMP
ncbi:MAG TPA: HupE/UreJ family protein [Chloroflexota bacterium]